MMILEDKYSGIYSGGRWLLIKDYWKPLTEYELNELNKHLQDTDDFYRNTIRCVDKNSILKPGSTRYDAIESTLMNSDCYATYHPWLWLKVFDDLESLNKFVKYQDQRQFDLDMIRSYKFGAARKFNPEKADKLCRYYQKNLLETRKEYYES